MILLLALALWTPPTDALEVEAVRVAQADGAPVEPLLLKVREGRAKGVSVGRITAAVRALSGRLSRGVAVCQARSATPGCAAVVADALDAGVPMSTVRSLLDQPGADAARIAGLRRAVAERPVSGPRPAQPTHRWATRPGPAPGDQRARRWTPPPMADPDRDEGVDEEGDVDEDGRFDEDGHAHEGDEPGRDGAADDRRRDGIRVRPRRPKPAKIVLRPKLP